MPAFMPVPAGSPPSSARRERRCRTRRPAFVLDCGERADMTQEAFRAGIKAACFSGPAGVATKLADIARQQRALLHRKRPKALDLLNVADPKAPAVDI